MICFCERLVAQQPTDASWRHGVSRWTGTDYVQHPEDWQEKPLPDHQIKDHQDVREKSQPSKTRYRDLKALPSPYPRDSQGPLLGEAVGEASATKITSTEAGDDGDSRGVSIGSLTKSDRSGYPSLNQPSELSPLPLRERRTAGDIKLGDQSIASTDVTETKETEDSPEPGVSPLEKLTELSGNRDTSVDVGLKLEKVSWSSTLESAWTNLVPRREWLKGWDSQAELGLDGSSGNASTLGVHTGFESKRSTKFFDLELDIEYRQTRNRHSTTEDNGRIASNFDRLFNETPHSAFGKFGAEWDRFKAFDLRLNVNGGYGYHWIRTDEKSFVTRFGAGASREIGAPSDQWIPEAVFGVDSERKFSARQKVKQKLEYFPAWENFGNFRLIADLSWETTLDEANQLSLKYSMNNRYDSTPQGARKNDLYYSLILLYKF